MSQRYKFSHEIVLRSGEVQVYYRNLFTGRTVFFTVPSPKRAEVAQ